MTFCPIYQNGWQRVAAVALALAVGLMVPAAAAQPPADAQADVTPPSARNLVKLNQGIKAYLEGRDLREYGEARQILEELRQEEPDNAACLYYLGLVYLSEGLKASQAARQEQGEQAILSSQAARASFSRARECLGRVVEIADRTLVPVEAALDLGVAQLASQDPATAADAAVYAQQGAETLERYVASEQGRGDRVGYFFLAVACYRLHSDDAGGAYLRKAADALRMTRQLALAQGELGTAEQARLDYYEALITLAQGEQPAARDLLQRVVERNPGGELGNNAQELLDDIEQREALNPSPIDFDTPLGKLRLEGFVNVGAFYDTNVILLGKDTALPRHIVKKADARFGVEAGFDITRLLTPRDGIPGESLLIGVGGSTAHLWQPSIGEFDVNAYGGRAYVNWEAVPSLYLGLQYDYSYTQLGHDPFISSNRLTPVISKIWLRPDGQGFSEERGRTDVYYSYDYRNYLDPLADDRFDRDGEYHTVGATQRFNLVRAEQMWPDYYASTDKGTRRDANDGLRWLEMRVGYAYRNERTLGDEFDLYGNSVLAGVVVPLPYRLAFEFSGGFTWDIYQHPSLFDFERKPRRDFVQRYDFGLTRTIIGRGEDPSLRTLEVKVRGDIELTFQDSNVWNRLGEDVYSYDRAIYSVKLMINF